MDKLKFDDCFFDFKISVTYYSFKTSCFSHSLFCISLFCKFALLFKRSMKHIYPIFIIIFSLFFSGSGFSVQKFKPEPKSKVQALSLNADKDTCLIEGQAFVMRDYRSKRVMRAYIKNSQLYVMNEGLQFAKYRIIQYIFSSLTNEDMPSYRAFNQRITQPMLQVLKNSRIGDQFLFEDIVVVDQSTKILANEVRPLMIERIKN